MASLTILTIFLVEVILKILAEGKHLLKHKAEVFDAIVVIVSFTMDVTFTFVSVNQATQDYAGLLVLLRLWRVTRIINGVILSVKMEADKKLNAQKALRAKAEKQVQRLSDKLDRLTRENEKLRTRLTVLENKSNAAKRASGTPSDTRESPQKETMPLPTSSSRDEKELSARGSHEGASSSSSSSSSLLPLAYILARGASLQPAARGSSQTPPTSTASLPQVQTVVFRESGGCLVSTSPPGEATFYKQCRSSSLCTPPESQQLLPFGETVPLDIRDSSLTRQQAVVSGVS